MSIFERTKEVAQNQGYTLRQVEDLAGLSPKSLYNWKKSSPKLENAQKVADVLNVSVDYLLGNTDEKRPAKKNPQDMNSVELEEALRGEGASLRFGGKELSDEYKRMILDILQNLK
ncbi:helix-turn-helix domain-containing protein [Weissella viridescens]|uniref:helix-turn-helix domain-containing protein n=1 Tax=Weissella viridescens TaxID=1629 RepID=UPI00174766FA|nr:helix-turn-helix transcriptional regulator [Weissella viridescens]MBX4172096.1 helix-turn-helix domain-containing protein [Weissella viridescens]MCB6839715.1 helix-turn-helix domain-containing protein [Weissella viridescens]MCB6846447.1 helix-turn-helix domain-containing protein [Weissella viridescens]QOD85719.1 helix-turn-helix transcriptional regulator [Weissella viridescens]WJI90833.1 helix-turn-helix transcriptional regulator [Weissella viridescens]